tara:strand:+ start:1034 stop:1219 length:186 start_codon:yes stop_codon:yes gene_type:complete
MIKCSQCGKIIGLSAPVYKASRGFLGEDGTFHEDESVVIHMECYNHVYDPFYAIENAIKNN